MVKVEPLTDEQLIDGLTETMTRVKADLSSLEGMVAEARKRLPGKTTVVNGNMSTPHPCPRCGASGKVRKENPHANSLQSIYNMEDVCMTCGGTGVLWSKPAV